MEISLDTSKLQEQLKAFHLDAVRRMEKMTEGFAYYLAKRAIFNTPIGDAKFFAEYYEERENNTGLLPIEGLSKGDWQFSKDGSFVFAKNYGQDSDIDAAKAVASQSKAYKLGETFYIGNATPYINVLEAGYSAQAPDGIIKPTVNDITNLYKFDFQAHYKKG